MRSIRIVSPSLEHMIAVGDKAPKAASLMEKGKALVLYFYPKDDTPGCTLEACGFRDAFEKLRLNATIIGVSTDDERSHQSFAEKYSLPFSLIADVDRKLCDAYGIGKGHPTRTTFLIDASGIVRKIYSGFDCVTHADDILRDLRFITE